MIETITKAPAIAEVGENIPTFRTSLGIFGWGTPRGQKPRSNWSRQAVSFSIRFTEKFLYLGITAEPTQGTVFDVAHLLNGRHNPFDTRYEEHRRHFVVGSNTGSRTAHGSPADGWLDIREIDIRKGCRGRQRVEFQRVHSLERIPV